MYLKSKSMKLCCPNLPICKCRKLIYLHADRVADQLPCAMHISNCGFRKVQNVPESVLCAYTFEIGIASCTCTCERICHVHLRCVFATYSCAVHPFFSVQNLLTANKNKSKDYGNCSDPLNTFFKREKNHHA